MSRLVWVSVVLAFGAVAALGLRWALADFLLDQFGSLPDSLTRAQHPEDERLASNPMPSSVREKPVCRDKPASL